jgi:hypothetical protein
MIESARSVYTSDPSISRRFEKLVKRSRSIRATMPSL